MILLNVRDQRYLEEVSRSCDLVAQLHSCLENWTGPLKVKLDWVQLVEANWPSKLTWCWGGECKEFWKKIQLLLLAFIAQAFIVRCVQWTEKGKLWGEMEIKSAYCICVTLSRSISCIWWYFKILQASCSSLTDSAQIFFQYILWPDCKSKWY